MVLDIIIIFVVFFVVFYLISRAIRGRYERKRQPVYHEDKYYYPDHVPAAAEETTSGSPVSNYDKERYDSNGNRIV